MVSYRQKSLMVDVYIYLWGSCKHCSLQCSDCRHIYIQDNLNININVLIFGGKINEVHLTFQWKLVRCIFSLKVLCISKHILLVYHMLEGVLINKVILHANINETLFNYPFLLVINSRNTSFYRNIRWALGHPPLQIIFETTSITHIK